MSAVALQSRRYLTRTVSAAILLVVSVACSPETAATQLVETPQRITSVEGHLSRLQEIDAESITSSDCESQFSRAEQLNASDLFYASAVCFAVENPLRGNFLLAAGCWLLAAGCWLLAAGCWLLAAGQVRATADLSILEPMTESDEDAAASIYGLIFFHLGGPGEEVIYRNESQFEELTQMIEDWRPQFDSAYDPGWEVADYPDQESYRNVLAEFKAHRLVQLNNVRTVFSDDQYYALHRRFAELQARVGMFTEGSPEYEQSEDLQRRMNERAEELGVDWVQ